MSGIVRFESYEVDVGAGQLRKLGVRINLRDQSFQVLAALLEHGAVVRAHANGVRKFLPTLRACCEAVSCRHR